jgi:hypothetical protein
MIDLGAVVIPASPHVTSAYSAIWPLRRWIKRLVGCLRMALLATNDHADLRMRMQRRNARYSADERVPKVAGE